MMKEVFRQPALLLAFPFFVNAQIKRTIHEVIELSRFDSDHYLRIL